MAINICDGKTHLTMKYVRIADLKKRRKKNWNFVLYTKRNENHNRFARTQRVKKSKKKEENMTRYAINCVVQLLMMCILVLVFPVHVNSVELFFSFFSEAFFQIWIYLRFTDIEDHNNVSS